jgi:hypothetical protein
VTGVPPLVRHPPHLSGCISSFFRPVSETRIRPLQAEQ